MDHSSSSGRDRDRAAREDDRALVFGWRRLNFFDKNVIMDPANREQKFEGIKVKDAGWTAAADGACVYIYEPKGALFALTRRFEENYWRAFQHSMSHAAAVGNTILLTVGEDDDTVNSLLKIWDCPSTSGGISAEAVNDVPPVKRTIRLSPLLGHMGSNTRATVIAGHSSMRAIAAGYEDGSVLCYLGDYLKEKAAFTKWIRVRESTPIEGAVTGLSIAALAPASPDTSYVLFVLTEKAVFSYVIGTKGTVANKQKLEASGATRECWTFSEMTNQLIVAAKDMVFFYEAEQCSDPEGAKGRCHALGRQHDKQQITVAGEHLALLTKQPAIIAASGSEWMSVVTVYDVRGQYIAFSCSLPSTAWMFVLDGQFMILGHDGTLSALTQKHLNAKLDILYKKNFYDVAISLAKRSEEGDAKLPLIHAKYADYLYGRSDYDNAMSEYKETIGVLEPSYIIKKFLDGSKMHLLCSYLEALHAKGKQNTFHSTILVNCYAKLNAREKILELIKRIPAGSARRDHAEAIVQALRRAKLSTEASLLAMKFQLHDDVLSILIQDLKKYADALKYIDGQLSAAEARDYVEKYGRVLLKECPEKAMDMLEALIVNESKDESDVMRLLSMFTGDEERQLAFIEKATAKLEGSALLKESGILVLTQIELKLRRYKKGMPFDVETEEIVRRVSRTNQEKVLRVAEVFECEPVIEAILKKFNLLPELFAFYLQKGRSLDNITGLAAKIDSDKVWLETLGYVSKGNGNASEESIRRLLDQIKKTNRVHPLVVLEILSRNASLKVSVVKQYVIDWLSQQMQQIETDKKEIEKSEIQVEEMSKQIKSLNFNPQTLQVNKCSACDTTLHLPSIHFLCRHAYHTHCLNSFTDSTDVCPACHAQQPPEERNRLIAGAENMAYSTFTEALNSAPSSMEVISAYLRNGLFDSQIDHHPDLSPVGAASASSSASSTAGGASPMRGGQGTVWRGAESRLAPPTRTHIPRQTRNPFEEDATNPFAESSLNPFEGDE